VLLLLCVLGGTAGNRDIGDEGVILIAEGLEMNISVKELHLTGVFPPHSFFTLWCISYSFICREYLI
jgi:hypothetical protein